MIVPILKVIIAYYLKLYSVFLFLDFLKPASTPSSPKPLLRVPAHRSLCLLEGQEPLGCCLPGNVRSMIQCMALVVSTWHHPKLALGFFSADLNSILPVPPSYTGSTLWINAMNLTPKQRFWVIKNRKSLLIYKKG
jgi:hypothetical protein